MKREIFKFRYQKGKGLLYNLVHLFIAKDIFNNVGKFKVGDKIKYNWMAKVYIPLAMKLDKRRDQTLTISEVYCKGENVNFIEGCGASVFWLRKAYWWEKHTLRETCNKVLTGIENTIMVGILVLLLLLVIVGMYVGLDTVFRIILNK
jgi:hypothetical protein